MHAVLPPVLFARTHMVGCTLASVQNSKESTTLSKEDASLPPSLLREPGSTLISSQLATCIGCRRMCTHMTPQMASTAFCTAAISICYSSCTMALTTPSKRHAHLHHCDMSTTAIFTCSLFPFVLSTVSADFLCCTCSCGTLFTHATIGCFTCIVILLCLPFFHCREWSAGSIHSTNLFIHYAGLRIVSGMLSIRETITRH